MAKKTIPFCLFTESSPKMNVIIVEILSSPFPPRLLSREFFIHFHDVSSLPLFSLHVKAKTLEEEEASLPTTVQQTRMILRASKKTRE